MKIVALEPFLVELVFSLDLEQNLVGIPAGCVHPEGLKEMEIEAVSGESKSYWETEWKTEQSDSDLLDRCCTGKLDLNKLLAVEPDVILVHIPVEEEDFLVIKFKLEQRLKELSDRTIKVYSVNPISLDSVYESIEKLGKFLKVSDKARRISQNLKAQFMDWGDNFYERMRQKKVSFFCSVDPLKLAGGWIPGMISLCSAESQFWSAAEGTESVKWEEVLNFRPDVIIVAPQELDVDSAAPVFQHFEKLPYWEDLPAVKRGEVYFTGGKDYFYEPTFRLIASMSVLVSAIAGFESGYIAPRGSFYKLRWLEMQRHRFTGDK